MKHRDSTGPDGVGEGEAQPDYAREGLENPERMAGMAEDAEPNFATKDIDPNEVDPIAANRPSFATKDIDPNEVDPVDPTEPNFATKDQDLG